MDVAAVPVADVPFLDPSIRYLLPPFDSQYAGKGTLFISLPVRNVDTTAAVAIDQRCTAPRTVHVRFQTLGAGYVTQHYALFVRLPYDVRFVQPDIWANEVTLRLDLDGCGSEQMLVFEAGIDEPSVERFESKLTAEISDDDGGAFGMQALDKALLDSRPTPGAMLKQRSYSESNCDDFKDAGDGDVDDDDNDDVDAFDASHQPKVRTYSECSVDSSASHGLKGILKRRSSSVLSEIGGSIPEAAAAEQMAGSLGKKSVRFDNNIRKLKFKLNSTVAGQRKPKANGHNRKKKKRCAERRYSEGEASDYDPKEAEDAACGRGQPSDAASQSPRKVPPNGSGVNGVPASRVAAAGGQRDDCDLDFKTNLIFDMDM